MSGDKRKCFHNCLCLQSDGISEPVAKRTRSAVQKFEVIPEVEESSSDELTVLNVLNDDCWKIILDYVSVRDIIRSERVSKCWLSMVHRYLLGARLYIRMEYYLRTISMPSIKCRILKVRLMNSIGVIEKYGPAIVASDCLSEAVLKALGRHCPDLEELRLNDAQYHNLKNRAVCFNKLRRLWFRGVIRFRDAHMSKFLNLTTLEELTIEDNERMTGLCLTELKSNLKTLKLKNCQVLDSAHLVSAASKLSNLTKLNVTCNSKFIIQNVYKLIQKTPKLEYLELGWYDKTDVGGLLDAICGLCRLKHLNLESNRSVDDDWLKGVARCCKDLRSVDVGGCKYVTRAGVLELCRVAGKTLAALSVAYSRDLTDNDVAQCIRYCPKLQFLDLSCSRVVTRALAATCARAATRRVRLNLALAGPDYEEQLIPDTETYENLILDFRSARSKCHRYC